jgi:hypothetical protein
LTQCIGEDPNKGVRAGASIEITVGRGQVGEPASCY